LPPSRKYEEEDYMKKFLAVLVVFTLIATAAFAQLSGGGGLKAQLGQGDSDGEGVEDISTAYWSGFWLTGKLTNDENTAGAKGSIGIDMKGDQDGNPKWNPTGDGYFYAFWQPINQLYLKIGKLGEDGKYWSGSRIVGWHFQANDLYCDPEFDYWNGFPGSVLGDGIGFFGLRENNYSGLQVSLLPIDGLAINLGWMIGGDDDEKFTGRGFKETFSEISAQIVYNIDGVGEAAVGFVNDGEEADKHLYVSWLMSLAGMDFDLGGHFRFNPDIDGYKPPIEVGVGFRYGSPWGSDPLVFTTRLGLSIGTAEESASKIGLQVCPVFDLSVFKLYIPMGIGMVVQEDVDTVFAWSLNPYIVKGLGGGVSFWAGLKLYTGTGNVMGDQWKGLDKDYAEKVSWGIPIGFTWSF